MAREYFQQKNVYSLLKNKDKYLSENKQITLRSGWEIQFVFKFLDIHPSVLSWSSEDFFIPYFCPIRKSFHRYFPDFLMKIKEQGGIISEQLLEIKPQIQIDYAKNPNLITSKRKTKSNVEEFKTAIINAAKWKAAEEWCANQRKIGRVIYFSLISEKNFKFI